MQHLPPSECLPPFTAMADPARRAEAAAELAQLLEADAVLVFIQDPHLGLLLPAPGWQQTLPDHKRWRTFLQACVEQGEATGRVRFPLTGDAVQATGLRASDGSVLVLIGPAPNMASAAEANRFMPLLAAALRGERAAQVAAENARVARETATRLNTLAEALDTTRLALQQALNLAAAANDRIQLELTERRRAEEKLRGLNETLERRVAQRTAMLKERNEELRAEVAERRRAENALEEMNEALLASNRHLQGFAYAASHDLQEPLRKISTFASLLIHEEPNAIGESGRFYLERIIDAASRMRLLIQSLLDLSRVSTQGAPFEPVDLNAIVEEVLVDLEVRIDEVGGHVEVAPLPTIDADATQVRQLFQNLISNALKFRRPNASPVVRIRAAEMESADPHWPECRLEVSDNGIGFEEQYLDRIFAPFQRLHSRSGPYREGTGMGLAICRTIVERHGGSITAQSRLDEGSTFIVTLRCRQPKKEARSSLTGKA